MHYINNTETPFPFLQVFLACHAIAAFCCIAYTLVPPVQICLPRMVRESEREIAKKREGERERWGGGESELE